MNAISPSVIRTPFAAAITDDAAPAPARLARTPLGRFGEPYHVAVDGGTLIGD